MITLAHVLVGWAVVSVGLGLFIGAVARMASSAPTYPVHRAPKVNTPSPVAMIPRQIAGPSHPEVSVRW